MKRTVIILLYFCLISSAHTQKKDRFIFGGTVSTDIGRFNDRIEMTLIAYKKAIPKCYVGMGATLSNYNQESITYVTDAQSLEFTEYSSKTKTTYYGASLFVRYFPFEKKEIFLKNIYAHSEFEYLKGDGKYNDNTGTYAFKTDNRTLFCGIGYKQLIGKTMALTANVLFKLNNEPNSPYRNPIIRIGFEL